MRLPALPPLSDLSTSRLIFCALLAIGILWWSARFLSNTFGPEVLRWQYAEAVDDYEAKRYNRSAWRYNAIVPLSDSIERKIVYLREQGAAYGQAAAYGKQLEVYMRARQLARRYGLDSLRQEASESIGNVIAACNRDEKFCEGIDQQWISNDRSMSSLPAMDPLLLFFVVVAGGGILWLLFVEEGE